MARKFSHEDISTVPRGWRVRTISRGRHRVRVAFPPGPRRAGGSKVVSVLHPLSERNCPFNPGGAELVLLSSAGNPSRPRVELYQLLSSSGKPIRKATKVVFPDGREVKFMERVPKGKAIREAKQQLGGNPRRVSFRTNSGKRVSFAVNPEAKYAVVAHHDAPDHESGRGYVVRTLPLSAPYLEAHVYRTFSREKAAKAYADKLTHAYVIGAGGLRGERANPRRPIYEYGNPNRFAVRWDKGNYSQPFATRAKAEKMLRSFGGQGRIVSVNPGAFSNPPEDLEQADELYEGFHGVPSEFFDVAHEPHIPSGNYVKVGKLVALEVKPTLGGQVREIKPSGVIVVSTPNGSQLHFVGGHQDLSAALRRYTADLIGEEIELGHARAIVYRAAKPHEGHAEQVDWDHKFGEEGGELPRVIFDKPNKRLLLRGGSYRVEGPWLRN